MENPCRPARAAARAGLAAVLFLAAAEGGDAPPADLSLRVHPGGRYLARADGTPFFWLGDTAWELFHRLAYEDADHYLTTRAAQGFTVIQAVALAEFDGLGTPTPDGHLPLVDRDPARPNEAYFAHVDRVVRRANELGLVVGFLPTWGAHWQNEGVFNEDNARVYGEWLGRRYGAKEFAGGLVWILGGDRGIRHDRDFAVVKAMAEGLRAGDGGRHLMTFHPTGGMISSDLFGRDDYLDFHMAQTGHGRNTPTYDFVARMFRAAEKPCLDGEPGYEDHPVSHRGGELGFLIDHDVRQKAWWGVLAGGFGHTYGCHAMWQFWEPGRQPVNQPMKPWRESLRLPGAEHMRHMRTLIESKPFFARRPLPNAVEEKRRKGWNAVVASGDDATYLLAYFPTTTGATIDMGGLAGKALTARWYDPRTGEYTDAGERPAAARHQFTPPANRHPLDWVLVLDAK